MMKLFVTHNSKTTLINTASSKSCAAVHEMEAKLKSKVGLGIKNKDKDIYCWFNEMGESSLKAVFM
jgi:hypothetical protein